MLRSHILTCALILGSISGMLLIAQSVPVQATHAVAETTISAQITGIRNTKGQLVLQLWNGPDGFPTKGNRGFKATNVAGAAFLNFTRQRFQRRCLRRVPRAENNGRGNTATKTPRPVKTNPGSSAQKSSPRRSRSSGIWRLSCLNSTPTTQPYRTMVVVARCTGLRAEEVLALDGMAGH
jgi:hypothetical protein